eukprot:jgi/Tetstr1/438794/TSEL_027303.t1
MEQSREYKGYCFLLTYIDHGIKFCFCTLFPNNEKDTIAGLEEDDMIENLHEDVLAPEKQAEEDKEKQQAEEQARQEQQP